MNCEASLTIRCKRSNGAAYHDITGEEVRATEDYHDEPNGKEHGGDSADKTRCIFLVPGCCFSGQGYRTAVAIVSSSVLSIAVSGSAGGLASKIQAHQRAF